MNKKIILSSLFTAIFLAGCQSTLEFKDSGSVGKLPLAQPVVSEQESLPLLRASGTHWVDNQGNKVQLKGLNLGNWLAMEMWMFGHESPMGEGITDQCLMESKLTERFGFDKKEQILKTYRDAWMTPADWNVIQNAGFNIVRLPFLYTLLEDPNHPKKLREDAWHYLDMAIQEAKARGLYVILDLHGAPGRQGWEQHTGCADKNELWDSPDNRDRTAWIWQELAKRYKNESAIAGYGLLNEPWGTDKFTLKEVSVELYQAIREIDKEHIIILPAHNTGGISAYGIPSEYGLTNVAFEHHAYPGMFGWGEIGYEVNRDWLTCGESGEEGVCLWNQYIQDAKAPLLIGEMQPWAGMGEWGGENTRATLDKYAELNWAATMWSYKNTTLAGGLGGGPWGLVTNAGEGALLTKAQTWSCNDWESSFEQACDTPSQEVTPVKTGTAKTMFLVIKTGAMNGSDITYDEIALTNTATGKNIVLNGDFEQGDAHWKEVSVWGDPRKYDFNYLPGAFAGSDTGKALRLTSKAGNNSFIYQELTLQPGQSYLLTGKSKDNGAKANNMWSEIYLINEKPKQWQDISGRVLPEVDINKSSFGEIQAFFDSFRTMEYTVNPWVIDALKRQEPSKLFTTIPSKPRQLIVNPDVDAIQLSWKPSEGKVDAYNVYRSISPRSSFKVIATVNQPEYHDQSIEPGVSYYYYVTAFNSIDESYPSDIEGSGESVYPVPGRIEAEAYLNAAVGVQTETARDSQGGGLNIGSFEKGSWVTYQIDVAKAGKYNVSYRVASLPGSAGFELVVNDQLLDTVVIPPTGDWQEYHTVTRSIALPQGKATLRLNSVSNQWNLNWIEFKTE